MRPGFRQKRPWWRRRPAWWSTLAQARGRPGDDLVLVLAVLCGLLGVVWALSVLAP